MEGLVIGVMSNTTLPKYQNLVLGCCETWVRDCTSVTFFDGAKSDIAFQKDAIETSNGKASFVNLPLIGDDYMSASWKQWLGLVYMLEKIPEGKWYAILGTDNYVYPERVWKKLQKYDYNEAFIVGGINGVILLDVYIPFLMGGSGLYFTRKAIIDLIELGRYKNVPEELLEPYRAFYDDNELSVIKLHLEWSTRSDVVQRELTKACDVAVCYYGWQQGIAMCSEPSFCAGSDNNDSRFGASLILSEISVCHFMTRESMHYHHHLSKDLNGARICIRHRSILEIKDNKELTRVRELCKECKSIAVYGKDIWAMLDGLPDGSKMYVICNEMNESPYAAIDIARHTGISLTFIRGDITTIISEDVDLSYLSVFEETKDSKECLASIASRTRRYIVINKSCVLDSQGEESKGLLDELYDPWNAYYVNKEEGGLIVLKRS